MKYLVVTLLGTLLFLSTPLGCKKKTEPAKTDAERVASFQCHACASKQPRKGSRKVMRDPKTKVGIMFCKKCHQNWNRSKEEAKAKMWAAALENKAKHEQAKKKGKKKTAEKTGTEAAKTR